MPKIQNPGAAPADPGVLDPGDPARLERVQGRPDRARAAGERQHDEAAGVATKARRQHQRNTPAEPLSDAADGSGRTLPRGRRDERARLSRDAGRPT